MNGNQGRTVVTKRPKPATDRELSRVFQKFYRLHCDLGTLAKRDPALNTYAAEVCKMWLQLGDLRDKRRIVEAQAKDARLPENERVRWTLFFPRMYGWEKQKMITCTINLLTETCFASPDQVRVLNFSASSHLDQEWHRQDLDLVKFRQHAERIDAEWARFRAKQPQEEAA